MELQAQRHPTMQELEDGIDVSRELAEALAGRRLSAGQIQGLANDAQATLDDLAAVDLPEVRIDELVASLRRQQRQRAQRRRDEETTSAAPPSQPSQAAPPPASPLNVPSYRPHAAFGYQTQWT